MKHRKRMVAIITVLVVLVIFDICHLIANSSRIDVGYGGELIILLVPLCITICRVSSK